MSPRRLRPLCAVVLLALLAGGALVLPLLHAAGHAHAHAEAAFGPSFEAPPCELCDAALGRAAILTPLGQAEARLACIAAALTPAAEPCAAPARARASDRAPPFWG